MKTTNLAQLIVQRATEDPSLRIGVVGDLITLADATGNAAAFGEGLAAERDGRTDPIAMVAHSSTDFLVAWMACQLHGIPVALINPDYPDELLGEMLASFAPSLIATDSPSRFGDGVPILDIATARSQSANVGHELPGWTTKGYETSSYMHTSGTTGLPKFCAQSHEYFLRLGRVVAAGLQLTAGDTVFAPLPLFHVNPLGYGVVGALTAGAHALSAERFSASGFWPILKAHGVTSVVLHEPPVQILKQTTTAHDARGHQLKSMFYTDAEFLATYDVPLAMSVYGSTEAGGISHVKTWQVGDAIPGNAGRIGGTVRGDLEWRLSDSGEIQLRERERGALFTGYRRSDALDTARDAEGWFSTGDLGERSESGELVFIERAAEAIRVKGEFVPVQHVEGVLSAAAPTGDVVIWKQSSALVDDEVVAYVDGDEIPRRELATAISSLPKFMRPKSVVRVGGIPRDTVAGKVRRRLLPSQDVLEKWEVPL